MDNSWAPTQLQISLYAILTTDTQLQTMLNATLTDLKVYDFVPDNEPFPYIMIESKPWKDRGNQTWEGLDSRFIIHVFNQAVGGRGDLPVQNIQYRIDQLLHEQDICIDGWNTIVLRREMFTIMTDPDNVTKHGIQRFKLFIGES